MPTHNPLKNMTNNKNICFILLPGLAPDAFPVLGLKKVLEDYGYTTISSNFFGNMEVSDFSKLSLDECMKNISKIIKNALAKYDKVFGIGISLGGAFFLEYAKRNNDLDGIISIGTPFKIRHRKLLQFINDLAIPIIYPLWNKLQQIKKLRLLPIGAGEMTVRYLEGKFLEHLENIKTPVLFLHSKKDRVTDYKALAEFSKKISSQINETIFFDNGNHVIDNDPQKVIAYVLNFINKYV